MGQVTASPNGATRVAVRVYPERMPAMTAAAALAAGIVLDRKFEPPLWTWVLLGLVLVLTVALLRSRNRTLVAVAILSMIACAGAVRHHLVWSARADNDISRLGLVDDTPVRVVGVIDSAIEIIPARHSPSMPAFLQQDRSVCRLRCESLIGSKDTMAVRGVVRFDADGRFTHVRQGDRVEVLGRLRIPQAPRSPGDFDFPRWLRAQGIDRILNIDHRDAVRVLGDASTWSHRWGRARERLRQRCDRILEASLRPETYPVGASLLLGTRTGLTDEVREAFINSGTMHLLAISGLHVAILAGCVLMACRGLNISFAWSIAITVLILIGYTVVTDLRPPVLRSAVLGCLVAAAAPGARRGSGFNLLAATAFLLLLWSPCDLFDIGAQLSFLAVAAILWSARIIRAIPRHRDPLVLESDRSAWRRRLDRFVRWVVECYVITASIWLFTLPITMASFHLISPVGFLINVILLPFSFPLLATGFLTLALGLAWAPLAAASAWAYDGCLGFLLWIVRASSDLSWSHWSVAGPSEPGLIAFYAMLAAAVFLPTAAGRRWSWRILSAGIALSLLGTLRLPDRDGLTCTFIDVGHGGAVLLELPAGRTVLYDAGAFGRSDRARRAIEHTLTMRRISRLDALVISHADVDHFNAAVDVIDSIATGGIYFSQGFLDVEQPGVMDLCEAASAKGVQLRILQAGDRLLADADVELSVIHPAGSFADTLDNAESIVLDVRYAGRRILLTGDLERSGLTEVLTKQPAIRTDLFQAPHHGSRSSNIPELDRWAAPRFVFASNNDRAIEPRLRQNYANADKVLTTAGSGTISLQILPSGEVLSPTTTIEAQSAPDADVAFDSAAAEVGAL